MQYDPQTLAQIRRGRSRFVAMVITYGLGVFNDSFFRQAAILLAVAEGHKHMQGWIMSLFALPYLLFASPVGWLADRFSKKHVVIGAKALEVVAMGFGAAGLLTLNWYLVLVMVFIMAMQSCLFSPALNGSIPELYPDVYVTRANATLKVVVTIMILAGVAAAGAALGFKASGWRGLPIGRVIVSIGVVAIAAGGLAMSFGVVRRPAADPRARFPRQGPLSTARELIAIRADSLLFKVVLATVFIWFAGSMLIQFITVMAVEQFEWGEAVGGYLVAAELVGLAAGGLLASRLGEGRWYRVIGPCMMAMAVVLLVAEMLPFMPASARLASAYGLLGAVGVLGGVVMIPCEAFIQRRPPAGRKGTVIASSNFGVFFGILVSGPLANAANAVLDEPTRGMALMGAVTLVVGALLRRAFAKEKGS